MDKVITVTFRVADESYNGELKAGYTADGKIVLVGDDYYMGPVHEALCFALDRKYIETPGKEDGHVNLSDNPEFSTDFMNDADTTAECLRGALQCGMETEHCHICDGPVPASKNHKEPVYVEGYEQCPSVCCDCLYKDGDYKPENLHKDYFHCENCGDYSKGDKCVGECKGRELGEDGYIEGEGV